jgi:small-conductance mechanosensitive channel
MNLLKTYKVKLILALVTQAFAVLLPDSPVGFIPEALGIQIPNAFKNIEVLNGDKRAYPTQDLQQQAAYKSALFFELIKKDSQLARGENSASIEKLQAEIDSLEKEMAEGGDKIFVKKKKLLLEDRIKVCSEIIETWKLIENSVELNCAYLKANSEAEAKLQNQADQASFYLDDITRIEEEVRAMAEKIKIAKSKKEKVARLVLAAQEKISSEKKELDHLVTKKNKLLEADLSGEQQDLRQKHETLDVKMSLKIDGLKLIDLKLKRLSLEIAHLDDEILIFNKNKTDLEARLAKAKEKLFVSPKDLASAQEKLQQLRISTLTTRESNKKIIDEKNKEKLRLEEQLERLEANLKTLSLKDLNQKALFIDESRSHLALIKQKKTIQDIENGIGILELAGDFEELKAFEQQFKVRNVEIRLSMKTADFNAKKLLNLMREEKKEIDQRIKKYDASSFLEPESDDLSLMKSQIKLKISEIENKADQLRLKSKEIEQVRLELEQELENLSLPTAGQLATRYTSMLFEIASRYKQLRAKYSNLIKEMGTKVGEREVWTRSPRAISLDDLVKSMQDAEKFFVKFFWTTQDKISPSYLIGLSSQVTFGLLLGLLVTITLFLLLYYLLKRFVELLRSRLGHMLMLKSGQTGSLPWTFLSGLFEFLDKRFLSMFAWLFIHLILSLSRFKIFGFATSNIDPYFMAVFYLASIPIFLIFSKNFLEYVQLINRKMSYFFFNEKSQSKNSILATVLLYSGSIILPLRQSFFYLGASSDSKFPAVLLAAYSLIVEIVVLLFFDKEDLLSIVPHAGKVSVWIKKQITNYYYPVFFFFMTILIIYNPYIGYFNLAWKLALLVPLSVVLIWALIFVHEYVRKNLIQVFIIENEDGAQDRFDNAKLLYGFIVIAIFLCTTTLAFFLVSRMWGFAYTFDQLWLAITTKWVIRTNEGEIFGLVQVFQFVTTIFAGFLSSSLVNNFILTRLFDAFDTEPGLQNTVSRISHYLIVFVFGIVGLSVVGFTKFVVPAVATLFLGITFALKDQVSDIAGGIFILLERQFEIGHFVELASEKIKGTVTKISFRSTVIKTTSNFFIAVPNRIMISKPVINWGMGKFAIAIEVEVEVDYAADPEKVREVIYGVLDKHEMILKSPMPVVRLEKFQSSGAIFLAKAFFSGRRVREIWNLMSDVRIAILKAFKQQGIKIPYPHRVVSLLSGEKPVFDLPEPTSINIKIVNQELDAGADKENKD